MGKHLSFALLPMVVMAIPMVALHELAHLVAIRARGLTPISLQLGAGDVVWKGKLGHLQVSLAAFPIAGLVRYLPRPGPRGRQDMLIVASAGPLANIAIACLAAGWPGYRLGSADGVTFSDIVFASNAYLAILCLWPLARGPYPTDGWQIFQALRGKEPFELPAPAKIGDYGLEALRSRGKSRRRGWMAFFALVVLVAAWFGFKSWQTRAGDFPILQIHFLSCSLVGLVCVWRLKAEDFNTVAEKLAKSPRHQAQHAFQRTLSAKIPKDWMHGVDKELQYAMGRATSGISREWENPLRHAFQGNPDNLLLGLFLYDCLSDAGKPSEAIELLLDLRRRFGFDGVLADYCEGLVMAQHLRLERMRHPAVQEPQSWLMGLDEAGKCHRLVCVAGTVLSSPELAGLLPLAVGWCDAALEIYPHDFFFLALKAALLVELGSHEEAGKIFHRLKNLPPGTREANLAMVGRALLAAKLSRPSARRLIRRALKQDLSPWMTRRLAGVLASLDQK